MSAAAETSLITRCRCCQAWRVDSGRLLLAPRGMAICDRCIQRASLVRRGTCARPGGRCRLCAAGMARGELIEAGVRICDPCLELCIELLRQAGIDVRPGELARATVLQNSRAGGGWLR